MHLTTAARDVLLNVVDGNEYIVLSGVTGTCQSSAAHSEVVYPGHHCTTSERFPTVADRLEDLASHQGPLFASSCRATRTHTISGVVTLLAKPFDM